MFISLVRKYNCHLEKTTQKITNIQELRIRDQLKINILRAENEDNNVISLFVEK